VPSDPEVQEVAGAWHRRRAGDFAKLTGLRDTTRAATRPSCATPQRRAIMPPAASRRSTSDELEVSMASASPDFFRQNRS
jgi:hypothetical protein